MFEKLSVEIQSAKSLAEAWKVFTQPEYITQWNHASDDWHCPSASNDLVVNGIFNYRMESCDGKYGFDFSGTYTKIELYKEIHYELADARVVRIEFLEKDNQVLVRETFDAETENSLEKQSQGWQAILHNYKWVLEAT